jgi:hypothetical protein
VGRDGRRGDRRRVEAGKTVGRDGRREVGRDGRRGEGWKEGRWWGGMEGGETVGRERRGVGQEREQRREGEGGMCTCRCD